MIQISDRVFHKGVQVLEIKIEISILSDHIIKSTNKGTGEMPSYHLDIISDFEANEIASPNEMTFEESFIPHLSRKSGGYGFHS